MAAAGEGIDRGKLLRRLRRRTERMRTENESRTAARTQRIAALETTARKLDDRVAQLQGLAAHASRRDAMGREDKAAQAAAAERTRAARDRDEAREQLATERQAASFAGEKDSIEAALVRAQQEAARARAGRIREARKRAVASSRHLQRSRGRTAITGAARWETKQPEYFLIGRRATPLVPDEAAEAALARPRGGAAPGLRPWRQAGETTRFAEAPASSSLSLGGIGGAPGPIDIPPPRPVLPPEAARHDRAWATAGAGGGEFHRFAYNRPPTAHEARLAAAAALPDRLSYHPQRHGRPEWKATDKNGAPFSGTGAGRAEGAAAGRRGVAPIPAAARVAMAGSADAARAIVAARPQMGTGASATWRGGAPSLIPRAGVEVAARGGAGRAEEAIGSLATTAARATRR